MPKEPSGRERQVNQYKPRSPEEDIREPLLEYWRMGFNDKVITERLLRDHVDTNKFGLSVYTLRRIRKDLGLERVRSQKQTMESLAQVMGVVREEYPTAGQREVKKILFEEQGMSVSRDLIGEYCRIFEPDLVKDRQRRKLVRRRFWAAGVNDVLAVDQHDKWQHFGLCLHVGMDPFCGRIHWLRIWHTNKDSKLIASYYLDFIQENKAMPLVTQSDPGTENFGIANAQTMLRHLQDPSLVGTLQHRWMREKKNVMPEIIWSQLRSRWVPGFENILQKGITYDWFDPSNPLDVMVFRWLFILWLQRELDNFTNRINYNRKRRDPLKVHPQGPPHDIYSSPDHYGVLDFKVLVDPEALSHVRQLFAPPDNPVFLLVPQEFDTYVRLIFAEMGNPAIGRKNIWTVYQDLRARLHVLELPENGPDWQGLLRSCDPEEVDIGNVLIPHSHDVDGRDVAGADVNQTLIVEEDDEEDEVEASLFDPGAFFEDDDLAVVFTDDEDDEQLAADW